MWNSDPLFRTEERAFHKVQTFSSEPLWFVDANDAKVTIISLCARILRAIQLHLTEEKLQLFDQLEELCRRINPQFSIKECLHWLRIDRLFPEIVHHVDKPSAPAHTDLFCTMAGYLAMMANHNQAYELAETLKKDVTTLTNHKYLAHQIVLLHQSVSKCGAPMEPYKSEIESNFEHIKNQIEDFDDTTTTISSQASKWLLDFLARLSVALLAYPGASRSPNIRDLRVLFLTRFVPPQRRTDDSNLPPTPKTPPGLSPAFIPPDPSLAMGQQERQRQLMVAHQHAQISRMPAAGGTAVPAHTY
eukprot:RCo049430